MERKGKNRNAKAFHQTRELLNEFQTLKNKGLMRKSYFVLIAAAASMLVSCSNDLLLDNHQEEPAPIGFTSYSQKLTKAIAETDLEFFHNTFVVYGTKKSTVDAAISSVFDGGATSLVTFSEGAAAPNDWTYSPYRYWDKQADYNFIAVAPNANVIKYTWDKAASPLKEVGDEAYDFVTVSGGYTLQGQNLQIKSTQSEIKKGFLETISGDIDLMTSTLNPQEGKNHTADVNLEFKHILAKLNVTVAKAKGLNDAAVYVRSVEITKLNDHGTYAESAYDATANPKESGWDNVSIQNTGYKLSYDYKFDAEAVAAGKPLAAYNTTEDKTVPNYFIESLVMPQDVPATSGEEATLILKYTIVTGSGDAAHSEDYTYKFKLAEAFSRFYDRCNYTLSFTINPTVITFDATVAEWGNGGTADPTID